MNPEGIEPGLFRVMRDAAQPLTKRSGGLLLAFEQNSASLVSDIPVV